MAYIAPNSTIRFHQNIALDNTYDHTYYFASLSAQNTFFSYVDVNNPSNSRVKLTIDNMSYQRHTRDSIKVALPIERIVNCNYMSFKNTSFENKWFYCFITDVEYVNNNTTIVYYEIDVMQTYVVNDITFDQCYIERQHTASDNIGENTQPEPIGPCEYVYNDAVGYGDYAQYIVGGHDTRYSDMSIVVACTFTGSAESGTSYLQIDYLNNETYWNKTINNSGEWVNTNDTGGYFIDRRNYTKIKITTPNLSSGEYITMAVLKSNTNFASGGPADFCNNTTTTYLVGNNTYEFDFPADCQYFWMTTGNHVPTLWFGKTSDWSFNTKMYGGLYGGCYSGVQLVSFPATISGANDCAKFLSDASDVANLIDGIISIFMIPTVFLRTLQTSQPEKFATFIKKYYDWTINGYAPKNNKLFTAPYTLLHVVNSDGNCADFSFEFSKNSDYYSTVDDNCFIFLNEGLAMPVSEVRIIPECYKGTQFNRNELFTINNYPQCSFTTDSYKAWLALNSSKMKLENTLAIGSAVLSIIGVADNISTANAVATTNKQKIRAGNRTTLGELAIGNTVTNAIGRIAGNLIEKKLASTMPPQASGQNTNVLNVADGEFGYHYYYCRPRDEYAKIIDDFFTRYGYAINRNAIPNLCARTRFTYIKTVDCTISGNLPNAYSQQIVDIMNNGITFWNDKTNVGNYEIANNIISG